MEITFLGTRGWYSKKGQTSCVLVETKGGNYVLDAGTGMYWMDEVMDSRKPTCILLSHFHLDHIVGIASLSKTFQGKELTICGQKGVEKAIDRIMKKPIYPFYFDSPMYDFKVRFRELGKEQRIFDSVVKTAQLSHSDPVLGYRIENDGKSLVYATDTLPCEATVKLAQGCDILVHETYFSEEDFKEVGNVAGHSSPREAARIAREAGAKGLFLFHFRPGYDERTIAGMVRDARKVFKNTFASKDFLKVKL
ncbi:MAG: MBL fold metallo-hydrolase [Candidatus Micrarchaeota archaeon]|nr:MBL fold metallo-hydrolase [Candidatus Micrarchaeota archaeon]